LRLRKDCRSRTSQEDSATSDLRHAESITPGLGSLLQHGLFQQLDGSIELAIDDLTLSGRVLLQAFPLSIVFLANGLELSFLLLAKALDGLFLLATDSSQRRLLFIVEGEVTRLDSIHEACELFIILIAEVVILDTQLLHRALIGAVGRSKLLLQDRSIRLVLLFQIGASEPLWRSRKRP